MLFIIQPLKTEIGFPLTIFTWLATAAVRRLAALAGDHSLFFFIHGSKTAAAGRTGRLGGFMRCGITVGRLGFMTFPPVVRIIFIFVIAFKLLIFVIIIFILQIIYFIQFVFPSVVRTAGCRCCMHFSLLRFLGSVSVCSCDHNFKDF